MFLLKISRDFRRTDIKLDDNARLNDRRRYKGNFSFVQLFSALLSELMRSFCCGYFINILVLQVEIQD